MVFTPVPGTKALFSIGETRVQDYAAYAGANGGVDGSWRSPRYQNVLVTAGSDCPVVNMSWEDAKAFCRWLTAKERGEGKLAPNQEYRLPTDLEWGVAVGLQNESGNTTPRHDSKVQGVYPWGAQWPPPRGAGNFADESARRKFSGSTVIAGYDDGYATASPVGSFAANQYGLYDLAGNVWEWCEDFYGGKSGTHVLRGGSWGNSNPDTLLSSCRAYGTSDGRQDRVGFRMVLGEASASGSEETAANAVASLKVSTQPPGATVRLDNAEPQKSPATFEDVSSGNHRIEVSMDGYEPLTREVRIRGSDVVDLGVLRLVRSVGIAKIVSTPEGVAFEIENREFGKRFGRTPQTLEDLPTGTYQVSVKRDRWPEQTKRITIDQGGRAMADFQFPSGSLKVSSQPAGAVVIVAGKGMGVTPLALADLPPGEIICDLKLKGYKAARLRGSIIANREAPLRIALEKVGPSAGTSWTNGLGSKFVPVPGTAVGFCVWDTRVKDFEAFATATSRQTPSGMECIGPRGWARRENSWRSPGFVQTPDDPVVGVSWDDAKEFCQWLTAKERNEEVIALDQAYRLPTSSEWRQACGGSLYPWGNQWPPPPGAGNYAGKEFDHPKYGIAGYRDGFHRTAPVGSFSPNQFGIYDLGGNVWQWCEDRPTAGELARINSPPKASGLGGLLKGVLTLPVQVLDTSASENTGGSGPQSQGGQPAKPSYFLGGGSWGPNPREQLQTAYRAARSSDVRSDAYGFRLVLDLQPGRGSDAATGSITAKGSSYSGGSSYQGTTYQGGTVHGGGSVQGGSSQGGWGHGGGSSQGGTVQGGSVRGGTYKGGTYQGRSSAPGSSSPGSRPPTAPDGGAGRTNRPPGK